MTIEQLYQVYLQHPNIQTDSRRMNPGDLFFALKGEKFDGNRFALQALEQGAAYAIIDDPAVCKNDRCILFEDVLQTLQLLATHHRRQFYIPVIAICGSNGKTTTKDLVSAVLSSHYPTHFTKGNFNNHIGVPLTLLAMPSTTEVAVLELGANNIGEVDFLCHIAEPTHGLITNIGKEHLEGFGGLEGVKQGESELYRYLAKQDGVAFINKDEPFLEELAAPVKKKLFYAQSESFDFDNPIYEVQLLEALPFVKVIFMDDDGKMVEIHSQLFGKYNFANIMTAIVLGRYFKVPTHKIKAAIEAYQPMSNRSQIKKIGTNTFVMDAYNANPSSMELAIQNFKEMKVEHKVAILGDMLELGIESPPEHQHIAKLALAQGFDQVIFVGKEFQPYVHNSLHFNNVQTLREWFDQQNFQDTHFLLKASRGIALEKMLAEEMAH
ncbi:MAG: UDP-N-acetylmuramoyl-tripeptide--D-alanyl-D-alanine ligase [Saprospiraceae bacterium]|nr:UDP-N-acetylmuramoyl-tripeptide--D-alanyl-D-alanine ligase [Saprospiraceae bacterium]